MVLKIDNVNKTYKNGKKKALNDFSAVMTSGVYGILGPNGAGKSTLMNIITDNIKADSGKVTYDDVDILKMGKDFRSILGYMPQHQGIYKEFTANRFLWYMASLKGMKKSEANEKIPYLFEIVNLQDDAHKKLGAYSGGMKQRILIAQALLNDPKVLILDEPTAGLDPRERIRIRNFISELSLNKIVLLATHVVSDIECIAKEVVLIKNGVLMMQDKPSEIIATMTDKVWEADIPSNSIHNIEKQYMVSNLSSGKNDLVTVRIVSDTKPEVANAASVKPSLEDMYLYMFSEHEQKVTI